MREGSTASAIDLRPPIEEPLLDTFDELTIPRPDHPFEALPTIEAKREAPPRASSCWAPPTIDETVELFEEISVTAPAQGHLFELEEAVGYPIVSKLGARHGFDFYLGDKPCFGISRRAIIKTALRSSPGYPELRKRLLAEARTSGGWRHPNLTALYDAAEDAAGTHLSVEYVEGTNLHRASRLLRARNEGFPFDLCVWTVMEVLGGLAFVHDRGVVLKELIPHNVLVATTGQIKLATFAFPLTEIDLEARPLPGAAAYLAPERMTQRRVDPRADVYAAGVLLLELLSGRSCYGDLGPREVLAQVVHRGLPLASLGAEGVEVGLIDIVERATRRDPAERFSCAASMSNALNEWMERGAHHATPSTIARFFDRQRLFDVEPPVAARPPRLEAVPLRKALDDADTDADGEGLEEPFGGTLSALIIREEIDIDITPQVLIDDDPDELTCRISDDAVGLPQLLNEDVDERTCRIEAMDEEGPPPRTPTPEPVMLLDVSAFRSREARAEPPIVIRPVSVPAEIAVPALKPWSGLRARIVSAAMARPILVGVCGATLLVVVALSLLLISTAPPRLIGYVADASSIRSNEAPPDWSEAAARPPLIVGAGLPGERGQLELRSQPRIRIFRDRELLGTTPLLLELPAGAHDLRLEEPSGGLVLHRRFVVVAQKRRVKQLTFRKSTLTVQAPEGARVYVGRRYLGRAPVPAITLYEGRHALRVVHGEDAFSGSVELAAQHHVTYRVEAR